MIRQEKLYSTSDKMTNLGIFAVLLLLCQCIEILPIDLAICQPGLVPCECGNTGIFLHLTVKQCSHFYRWQHRCDLCDGFDKETFCSKFKYCLECDSIKLTCSTCSPDRYGKLCTGICNCHNGGTCIQENGVCICPPKFEGKNCETKKLISCEPPEKLPNGFSRGSSITEGSIITYECKPVFYLYGEKVRTCTEDRIWTGSLPTCLPVCVKHEPKPHLIETAVDLHNDVVDLSLAGSTNPIKKINYKCADGFKLVGEQTIVCRKNGRWNTRPPICKAICPVPYPPINGRMTGGTFIEDDVVEFSCDSKFSLNGSSKSICLKDRTWSSTTPKCDQQTVCSPPVLIMDGERVHCNKDYIMKAVENVNCKTKGRDVIGGVGEFIRIDCPPGCFGVSNVIGTGIYSQNSLVCRAGIHIGKIPASGGALYVVNNGKFSSFVSSFLNGVQSLRMTKSTDSFRFADFQKKYEVSEDISCPFGWESFENLCLHFPITSFTWNEAKVYCENIQGHLVILHEADHHFSLTSAMEVKGIPKAWIGLENNDEFSWIDGKLLINSEFDAWLHGEPQDNKTCVYTSSSGWATENCEVSLPFICNFEKGETKNNEIICQDPSPLDNGVSSVDGVKNLVFYEGAFVNFSCNQYYYLQGSSHIHCLENGTWSQANPKCQFVPSCPEPPKLANGRIDHFLPPESRPKIQVFRQRNINVPIFTPHTDETSENEHLRGRNFSRMDFGLMTSRKETEVQSFTYNFPIPPNHHHVGTKVRYACESGFYDLIGSKTSICQSNGKWTDNVRTCKPVCGKTYFSPPPLIINGSISNAGQWPWQAALSMNLSNTWEIVCGGSVVNNKWIITAAQCVTFAETTTAFSTNELLIQLGKHFRSGDDDYIQEFKAHRIIVHPDYNPRNYDSDIALIELNVPVQFNHRVQPICLPPSGNVETSKRLHVGQKGFVTGWGEIEEGMNPEELHYVVIPIVSKEKCEKEYEEAGMPFHITDKMYCAGYEEGLKDACNGDSGGPMVFQYGSENKKTWLLEGIVSVQSPNGCALPNQYSSYTRIELFIDWIDNYI